MRMLSCGPACGAAFFQMGNPGVPGGFTWGFNNISLLLGVSRGSWCTLLHGVVESKVWRGWDGGGLGKTGCKLEKQPSACYSSVFWMDTAFVESWKEEKVGPKTPKG